MINNKISIFRTVIVIIAAIVITKGWFTVLDHASDWALLNGYRNYYLAASHLTGMAFLLIIALPYHRWLAPLGFGKVWQRSSVLPAVAVVTIYLVEYIYGNLTGGTPEKWVVELLNQPFSQLSAVFLTIFVLAPISEEIVFRGVILNVFRSSRTWTLWVGIVLISVLFTSIHHQYQNISTFVEIISISIIFAWARIRSGGLMLPIMLHSLTAMLAVIFTWLG